MSDELEKNRQKGAEWIQAIHDQPEIPFNEIYELNGLSIDEITAYDMYLDIIGPYLQLYKKAWGISFPKYGSKIKWLGGLLVTLNSPKVLGDKRAFIKTLFSKSLDIACNASESGFHIGRKSNKHEHILLELKVLDVLVCNGFVIDLDKNKLPSGKRSEFVAQKDSLDFHVEAKALDSDKVYDTVYDHPDNAGKSSFLLNEEQQRSIREQFKNQLRKAVPKFKGYKGYYLLVIDLQFPLGLLGEKLISYLNKYQPEPTCLGFIMVESGDMKIYRNLGCCIDINDYLAIEAADNY